VPDAIAAASLFRRFWHVVLGRELHDADREYGPRYSPTWFEDETATEAGRVRFLRTVYSLADTGLLTVVKSEGGRIERLRLTKAGRKAASELEKSRT
jgi:hypothetical protein